MDNCGDPIVESVISAMRQRSLIGQATYGRKLDRTDLSLRAWLQHAKEEAMDLALYCEAAIRRLDAGERLATRDTWGDAPSGWAGRGA